jgi:hypothetical protein
VARPAGVPPSGFRPPTAAAFRLVSRLPLREAALAWTLLSVLCLAGIGWLLPIGAVWLLPRLGAGWTRLGMAEVPPRLA